MTQLNHDDQTANEDLVFLKKLIFIISGCCCGCGLVWSGMFYCFFGFNLISALPLLFVVLVSLSMAIAYIYKQHLILIFSQLLNIILIPTALNWEMGGIGNSGAVIIWGFLGPIGALLFLNKKKAAYFLIIFICCSICSIALPNLANLKVPIEPSAFRTSLFFIMNIVTPLVMVYYVTLYFFNNMTNQKGKMIDLFNVMKIKNKKINDSITYAKTIQDSILPSVITRKSLLPDSFVLYKPKDVVSGDFYWMQEKDNTTFFAVADCTGHGVPGAMVSVICNNAINRAVNEFNLFDPGKILDKARELVIQGFEKSEKKVRDGMDIGFCAITDNTMKFAGAYSSVFIIRDGEVIEQTGTKSPIGIFYKSLPFQTTTIDLKDGDMIYLTTDGYVDQFHYQTDKKISKKRLKTLLQDIYKKNTGEQLSILEKFFEDWKGTKRQIDDVCVMGTRFQL